MSRVAEWGGWPIASAVEPRIGAPFAPSPLKEAGHPSRGMRSSPLPVGNDGGNPPYLLLRADAALCSVFALSP